MKFVSAILLGAATLATAAPIQDSEANNSPTTAPLNKRFKPEHNCGLDMYTKVTEARVANIIGDFTNDDCTTSVSGFCKTTTLTALPGQQGKVVNCVGHTGVFLSVDPPKDKDDDLYNIPFTAGDIGKQIAETYSDCFGRDPNHNAGDGRYDQAFQFWGHGYNLLVAGNVDCKANGFNF